MDTGSELIDWTARGAVAFYGLRVLLAAGRNDPVPGRGETIAWGAGWLMLVLHVVGAFHFRHGWQQSAALEHTAERTFAAVGVRSGAGLYVNYLTLAVWGADAFAMFLAHARRQVLPKWWRYSSAGLISFVVVNATLVFGARWWFAAAGVFACAWLLVRRRKRRGAAGT